MGSTEIANLRSKENANNPDWFIRFYGIGVSEESGAFTLLVCSATVSSRFPRKLSPFMLNTVASSKIRSRAHSSASSSLKLVLQWDGCLLLVNTRLSDSNTEPLDSRIDFVQQEIIFLETYRDKSEYLEGYASKYMEDYQRIFQSDDLVRRTAKDGTVLNTVEERAIYDAEHETYNQFKSRLSSAKSLAEKFDVLAAARSHGFISTVITAEIEEEYIIPLSVTHSSRIPISINCCPIILMRMLT